MKIRLQIRPSPAIITIITIVIAVAIVIILFETRAELNQSIRRLTDAVGGNVDGTVNVMKIVVKPFHPAATDGAIHSLLVSAATGNNT